MLSLRARLFIIISLVVLFVLGISLFLIMRSKQTPVGDGTSTTTANGGVVGGNNFNYNPDINSPLVGGEVPEGTPIRPSTSLETNQNAVRQLAKIFVERYNSYSTDSDFQNIIDVKELVTPALWQTLSAKIGKAPATGSFVGVTTKVFTTEIKTWENNSATVNLNATIREEKNGVSSDRQQSIAVEIVKNGEGWLVSSFQWAK